MSLQARGPFILGVGRLFCTRQNISKNEKLQIMCQFCQYGHLVRAETWTPRNMWRIGQQGRACCHKPHRCKGTEPVESFALTSAPFASSNRITLALWDLLACDTSSSALLVLQKRMVHHTSQRGACPAGNDRLHIERSPLIARTSRMSSALLGVACCAGQWKDCREVGGRCTA